MTVVSTVFCITIVNRCKLNESAGRWEKRVREMETQRGGRRESKTILALRSCGVRQCSLPATHL